MPLTVFVPCNGSDVNKSDLIAKIVANLSSERDLLAKAARAAHAESTHEQSKADNKYDTRGLEASYLAHGQAQQAIEVGETIRRFESLPLRQFAEQEGADVGALVEVDHSGNRTVYLLGPGAGGMEVELDGREVLVLTPASPLGRQLMGRKKGERVKAEPTGMRQGFVVTNVT